MTGGLRRGYMGHGSICWAVLAVPLSARVLFAQEEEQVQPGPAGGHRSKIPHGTASTQRQHPGGPACGWVLGVPAAGRPLGKAIPTKLPPYAGMAVNPGPSTQRWVPASMPRQVSRGTLGCRVRAAEDPGWKQGEHGAGRPPAAQGTEALCPQNAKAVPEHPRHRERQPAQPVWQHRGCILSHGAASCGEEQGARLQPGESLGVQSPMPPLGPLGSVCSPSPRHTSPAAPCRAGSGPAATPGPRLSGAGPPLPMTPPPPSQCPVAPEHTDPISAGHGGAHGHPPPHYPVLQGWTVEGHGPTSRYHREARSPPFPGAWGAQTPSDTRYPPPPSTPRYLQPAGQRHSRAAAGAGPWPCRRPGDTPSTHRLYPPRGRRGRSRLPTLPTSSRGCATAPGTLETRGGSHTHAPPLVRQHRPTHGHTVTQFPPDREATPGTNPPEEDKGQGGDTGMLGWGKHGDNGIWGHQDFGTWGCWHTGTWKCGYVGTWGHRSCCWRQPWGCAGGEWGTPPRPSPCRNNTTSGAQHGHAGTGLLPCSGEGNFRTANRSRPSTVLGPRGGHALPPHHPWQGPSMPGSPPAGRSWVLAQYGTARHATAETGQRRPTAARRPISLPSSATVPETLQGKEGLSLGCRSVGWSGDQASQVGDADEEEEQQQRRWCQEAKAGCRSPGRSCGGPAFAGAQPGPVG